MDNITYTFDKERDIVIKSITSTIEVEIPAEQYRNQLANAQQIIVAAQDSIDDANNALNSVAVKTLPPTLK